MLSVLNKYFHAVDEPQTADFAKKAVDFIYQEMRARKSYINILKSYYNQSSRSCIIKMNFNEGFVLGMADEFLYFLIEFDEPQICEYGAKFEIKLIHGKRTIKLKRKDQVLIFYPENKISKALMSRLAF